MTPHQVVRPPISASDLCDWRNAAATPGPKPNA
jgi:hypothetical protein